MGLNPLAALGAVFLIWFGLETLLSIAKGWQLSYLAPAIFVVREGVMLAVWIHAWLTNQVVWATGSVQARVAAPLAEAPKEEG
jgi:ceramide glucosyltransferase